MVIEKDVNEDLTSETCPLDKDKCCIVSSQNTIQLQLKRFKASSEEEQDCVTDSNWFQI